MNYIHLSSWILGLYKRQSICLPCLSNTAWGTLTGLSEQGVLKNKREHPIISETFQTMLKSTTRRWGSPWHMKSTGTKPSPLMQERTAEESFWLPPWATVLSSYFKNQQESDTFMALPAGSNGAMAKLVYERLRRMKSRKMIFVRGLIPLLAHNYDVGHGGIVTGDTLLANKLKKLIKMLELPGLYLEAYYRRYKSLSNEETNSLVQKWSKALGIPSTRVSEKDFGPEQGKVVIKLLQRQSQNNIYSEVAIASTGWRFVLHLISQWQQHSGGIDP